MDIVERRKSCGNLISEWKSALILSLSLDSSMAMLFGQCEVAYTTSGNALEIS